MRGVRSNRLHICCDYVIVLLLSTDDGQMLLALAASLVNQQGACKASDIATEYAKAFDPSRGYGGSAQQVRL